MTLDSGFGLYAQSESARQKATKKYQSLTDKQKEFYNKDPFAGGLAGLLVIAGIAMVTEATIPIIIYRLEKCRVYKDGELTPEMLKPFVGFEANVGNETDLEWAKRHFVRHFKYSPPNAKKLKADQDATRLAQFGQ